MNINFLTPEYLWLLAILPIIAGLIGFNESRRRARLESLGSLSLDSKNTERSIFLQLIILVPLTLIIIAIARPYSGSELIKIPRTGSDTMLLIDISKSMLAKDMKSASRMDFVKRKVLDLTNYIEQFNTGERLGIVLFAGESYLYCPLTEDYGVLRFYIKSIGPDLITSTGSALFNGVNTAFDSLKNVKAKYPRILIMSDGEDNSINIDSIIALSKEREIPIDLIGVGTPDGAPIELSDGSFLKDKKGDIVLSKLNEESLRKIANGTNGRYVRATINDRDFENIFKDREDKTYINTDESKEITIYHECGKYLLLASILFMSLISYFGKREVILFSLLLFATSITPIKGSCQTPSPITKNRLTLNEAYHAYNEGKFEQSLDTFKNEYELNPRDKEIAHAYGSNLYKLGKYSEAKSIFESLALEAKSGRELYNAHYDLGNVHFMLKDYQESINNYEKALSVKPKDEKATINLNLAKKRLEEEKQKIPTPTPTPENSPSSQLNNQPSTTPQPSPSSESTPSSEPSHGDQDNQDGDKGEATPEPSKGEQDKESEKPEKTEGDTQEESKSAKEKDSDAKEETDLSEKEAKAWLDSLSDEPILLRRQVGRPQRNQDQAW